MMVGVDVANVARVRALLERYPKAAERFFSDAERRHCLGHRDPAIHFAGTFAAKEAVVKALRLGSIGALVREIEISRDGDGIPSVRVRGEARDVTLSISHDAGIAVAVAVAGRGAPSGGSEGIVHSRSRRPATAQADRDGDLPRPNPNLARYLRPSVGRQLTPGSRLWESSESFAGSDFP